MTIIGSTSTQKQTDLNNCHGERIGSYFIEGMLKWLSKGTVKVKEFINADTTPPLAKFDRIKRIAQRLRACSVKNE